MEEMKKYLDGLLQRVDGLVAITIADRDGVSLIKVSTDQAPELAIRPSYLSTFSLAADQGSKLGLGKTEKIISMYSNYQVIQIDKRPLTVSFIASKSANTGRLLELEEDVDVVVKDLGQAVVET